jgi:hypothetical protein
MVKGIKIPFYTKLSPAVKGIFKKTGLIKTVWLRPSTSSFKEMKWLVDQGGDVLNMMFHSTELMLGYSPYIKKENEYNNFWQRLDNILEYLINKKKIESKNLRELIGILNI